MTTSEVSINGMKVTETITNTPNMFQQLLGFKEVVTASTYTILDRTFSKYPACPVLMDSKGAIMSPFSKVAELVKHKAMLMKYNN